MRIKIFLFALWGLAFAAFAGGEPSDWQLKAREDFAARRFGIFIHFGLYSTYAQGEWYLENAKLDEAAYARAMYGFCPSKFDAKEWVAVFKRAGARYVTLTARHHDGFSLWPTAVDDGYNIARTPFARDLVGELAAACREAGLEFNLYYSLMDWHRRDYPTGRQQSARASLGASARAGDYPAYKRFMLAQLKELLERYRPGLVWFDGEWDHDPEDENSKGMDCPYLDWGFDEIYDLVHAHRALVANNNHKLPRPGEDVSLFERDAPGENTTGYSGAQAVVRDRPLEQCDVIQRGVWGYRIEGAPLRSAAEIATLLVRSAAKGSNLLLNIGPDGSGQLPAAAVQVLAEVGDWLAANGEAIYGTAGAGVVKGADGSETAMTVKDGRTFVFILREGAYPELQRPEPTPISQPE